ncbi:MAG: GAF domain-containing protein, partial [Reyranellales bacterium]
MAAGPDAMNRDALERELAAARAERDQALEQQTATADILRVISQSPTDIGPVMAAVAKAAVRFCGAEDAHVFLRDGHEMVSSAHEGPLSAHKLGYRDALDAANTARADTILEARVTHLPDTLAPEAEAAYRSIRENSIQHGFRAQLNAPMLKDGRAIGCICLRRREPGAFTPRQIALLETFAAQAVIAIENVRLFTELNESLEQQTATTEVLEVINASPGRLEPVLDAMLEKAMHLCEAAFGIFGRFDGQLFEPAVDRGVPAELIVTTRRIQSPPPASGLGRLAAGESVVQLIDLANTDLYRSGFVGATALVDIGGARTAIFVALRRDDRLVGVIVMYRREVRAFSDKQVALLQNFAAQAVIAMENARLLTEQREALEQQTATAEILRAISRSPTDVRPVLDVVVKAAQRFCGAEDVVVSLREGDELAIAAHDGPISAPPPRRPLDRSSTQGRAVIDATAIHLPDIEQLNPAEWSAAIGFSRPAGAQAAIAAPMLREGTAVGAIMLRRREPGPFSPRQIELLEIFAAQAVIAIENVRLFTELKESLDQQTATAAILQVINASPGNLAPVFQVILEKAHSTCGADMGSLFAWDGTHARAVATLGYDPEIDEILRKPHPPIPGMVDLLSGERFIHRIPEQERTTEPHTFGPRFMAGSRIRTNLIIPLRKDDTVLGFISANRREVRPYSAKEIALLESFAAQAVIAMENARLLGELRDSLEQQTASADVLRVISQSPTSVQPVFDVIAESALRLLHGWSVIVWRYDGSQLHLGAAKGGHPGSAAALPAMFEQFSPDDIFVGDAVRHGAVQQIVDVESDNVPPHLRELARVRGWQSNLAVPMMREGQPVGVFTLARAEPGAFSERDVQLLQSFAAQAVIAIENVRLFTE